MPGALNVIFSIDVEEEGLFRGTYEQTPTSLSNLPLLSRLEKLTAGHGIPLTLLCDYPVLKDPAAQDLLLGMRERGSALGLHMHHWNTPPLQDASIKQPVPSIRMSQELLGDKLDTLLEAYAPFRTPDPICFRMGRWDFSPPLREALIASDIRVDSSITPLRPVASQKEHFLCGVAPYWLSPHHKGMRSLLEMPLTLHPFSQQFARLIYKIACKMPEKSARSLLRYFRLIFVVGVQPVWYPLQSMKWASMFHVKQKESFLVMFMHSSELLPGANPGLPTQASVDNVLQKIDAYLSWLGSYTQIRGTTFPQAYDMLTKSHSSATNHQTA